MYKCIFRNLDPAVLDCQVQICRYEDMDRVQMDQGIDKSDWGQWDVQTIADKEASKYHFDFVMTSDTDSDSVCSENTIAYDITSDMIIDCDIDLDSMNEQSVNEIPALPDLETLRAELNVLGGNESPPADL